jgi:HK97 family phage major capsid protein
MSTKNADLLRARVVELEAERNALGEELDAMPADTERSTDDKLTRTGEILARGKEIKTEIDDLNKRAVELDTFEAERAATPTYIPPAPKPAVNELRTMTAAQLSDTVLRSVEANDVDPSTLRRLLKRHGSDTDWLRNIAARSTDVYAGAWMKYITGREGILTGEERAALAVGTNTQGGYLVPTFLDPSLIITSTGGTDVIGDISRKVTLTEGNVWYGVTSAGVTASWDGELVEVSDDTPAVGTVSIPIYKGAAFVQASVEAMQDITGLQQDVTRLLADAKDRLLAAAHATGSGSGQPTGIFTALDANTNVELTSTTAATIGLVDLQAVKRATPQRYRVAGSWVMNPVYGDAIKNLGTALSASYSTDLTEDNADRLLGRPAYETDWAPSTQTTTVRDNEIVFGDFSNYITVEKPGSMSIEYIPMMFNTANNLPDGRRGWYMWFRHGADSVNDDAFRLLQDKTSA